MRNVDLRQQLDAIKKPSLTFTLLEPNYQTPALKSYIGGTPFLPEATSLPLCHDCQQPLHFVMQLITYDKKPQLHSFFYCLTCCPTKGNKGFRVLSFPITENATPKGHFQQDRSFPTHQHLRFDLTWSLPDWNALVVKDKRLSESFFVKYDAECQTIYESMRDDILETIDFDVLSFFGGYPNFAGYPHYPTCECCQKQMDLWLQMDSREDVDLVWRNYGCLYLFRCQNQLPYYEVLIQ